MHRTSRRLGLALALLASACPGAGKPRPSPTPTSTPTNSSPPSGAEPIFLDVVAPISKAIGTQVSDESTYLNGMQVAVEDVNAAGGVGGRPLVLTYRDDRDDAGEATRIIGDILSQGSTAILYVGPGTALTPLQAQFAQTGTPVVLLEGDLYTSRDMFRQVFQTTIPWSWQVHVIARYVVTDRKADDVVFVGTGPEAQAAKDATASALRYWGGHLTESFDDSSRDPTTGMSAALDRAASADWVVAFGPPVDLLGLVNGIEEAEFGDRHAGITSSASLLVSDPRLAQPDPGRTACYTYTWAGWAEPIPRVGRFLDRFEAMFRTSPIGLEQEGYDAVRVLVHALKATGGVGGAKLTSALEEVKDLTFSSFPIDLGPDDHLFMPRDELGLFAVPGRKERLDPWQLAGGWRPVMRTFTYDGERDNILDRDRRVFFPFWRMDQPGPEYWRSRYGIVTGPQDPLH
jgi:branched-chain amino acid transport system substrate-binding protein